MPIPTITWRQFYERVTERFGVQHVILEDGSVGLLRIRPDGKKFFISGHVYLDSTISMGTLLDACDALDINPDKIIGGD